MTPEEYQTLDAVAIDHVVSSGAVTELELAELALVMHHRTHNEINAVLEWYDQPTPARPVEGGRVGLRGVPTLRKDYGAAERGRLVEMGSRLAQGNRATSTGRLVELLQQAGAQITGRSAVPEFIQHGVTSSLLHGITRNPHDLTVSAGGSSGGAAAAVAAGVVPIAHASDCAGSIRIPAATCGLIGLKPGRGRVPLVDDWNGIAQEFVITRSVRDARRCLDILAVGDYQPVPRAARCAISTQHWAGASQNSEVVAATESAATVLVEQGHTVEVIEQPVDYDLLSRSWLCAFSAFAFEDAERLSAANGRPINASTLEPMTLAAIEAVRSMSSDQRASSIRARELAVQELTTNLDGYDVIITPTLGRPTIPVEGVGGHASPDKYPARNDEIFPYNYAFNLTGWPSISVPAGTDRTGHPLGVQLSAPLGSEHLLLDLAQSIVDG